MVGSLIIGVNNNSPLQMMRYESGRKTHGHGGYDGINMCLRRFFSVIEHYGSLAGLYRKREYLANCTITYGSLTKTRVVRWVFFVFVSGTRYILVLSYGSKDAELERLNGCL